MSKAKPDKVCTIQFHFCEFQEAKLIYSKRFQESGCFPEKENWLRKGTRKSGVTVMFYILIELLVM